MTVVIVEDRDAIEPTTILEFFAGGLRADVDSARNHLFRYGADSIDDLQTDTTRLIKLLEAT